MAVLTPITSTHMLARIVPVPSPELEKLPPASPLPITQEEERAGELTDAEESQTGEAVRYTPRDPPSIIEDDPTDKQTQVGAQSTEAEPVGLVLGQPQPVGSYLDLVV